MDIVQARRKLSHLQGNYQSGVVVLKAEIWSTFQPLTIFLLTRSRMKDNFERVGVDVKQL